MQRDMSPRRAGGRTTRSIVAPQSTLVSLWVVATAYSGANHTTQPRNISNSRETLR